MLSEDNYLEEISPYQFLVIRKFPSKSERLQYLSNVRQTEKTIQVLFPIRCMEKLHSVLLDKETVLPIIFPPENEFLAEQIYTSTPGCVQMNSVFTQAVENLLRKRNSGCQLKVLEIGAGTGSATEGVLKALVAEGIQYSYTYTGKPMASMKARTCVL